MTRVCRPAVLPMMTQERPWKVVQTRTSVPTCCQYRQQTPGCPWTRSQAAGFVQAASWVGVPSAGTSRPTELVVTAAPSSMVTNGDEQDKPESRR